MSVDVSMDDEFDWSFPEQWISVVDMEDDESSLTVTYEVIDTDKVLEVAALIYAGGIIPDELLTPRKYWAEALAEAMSSEEPLTLEETLDGVRYWVETELNGTMESSAQRKFDDYRDGSHWENYYD